MSPRDVSAALARLADAGERRGTRSSPCLGLRSARAACALLLPASLACHAEGALERLDLRLQSRERPAPRFMLVPEPADELRGDAESPRLAFEKGEGPISLPVGALRMRLAEGSTLSLRPRRGGVAVAWRKQF